MAIHTINKGLDLPITGDPVQKTEDAPPVGKAAVLAADYIGMKPAIRVQLGEVVRRGQPLFEDKKTPGVLFTAPAAGKVVAINRGERRAFQSLVIELSETEKTGQPEPDELQQFESFNQKTPSDLTPREIKDLLVESGLWTAIRTRPYGKVPALESTPHSLFVTAIDTNPLAPSVQEALRGQEDDFQNGIQILAKLSGGKTYVCKAPGSVVPVSATSNILVEEFQGPHPAGLPGMHIHLLDPVHSGKTVWYVNYQDAAAVGKLFADGVLPVDRVVSLAGPAVKNPRLLRTRVGASTDDLTRGELDPGENRVISGSVLSGRAAMGETLGYLGRRDNQITVLAEGRRRELLGWMNPGANKFSTVGAFLSKFLPAKKYNFTTNTNGSPRAMVPIGMYERVMPMDIMPTFLLRSLIVEDLERAEKLGCLELEEEDLALCTFVCPGKTDYGSILRKNLTTIEKEG